MLKIGNFSRIANVSVRLLHYYEEIGLFKPSHIDAETGYRYYKTEQMMQLNKILALKDLGLSLQEIKLYVDDEISREQLQGMLKLKKSQVYQSIEEELSRLRRIEYRLEQLDSEEMPTTDNVLIKTIPTQHYLSVRNQGVAINDFGLVLQSLMTALSGHNIKRLGTLTILEHSETFPEKNLDLEVGFVQPAGKQLSTKALVLNDNLALSSRELPTVTKMATLLHIGAWGTGVKGYLALGNWIETNGYEIVGATREVYIELASKDGDANIVEFQLPIQSVERTII